MLKFLLKPMLISTTRMIIEYHLDDFVYKYWNSGYHPLFFISEPSTAPRGWWLANKLPPAYYVNKTQFFFWPSGLDYWSMFFRKSGLLAYSSSEISYKQLSSIYLTQIPYWCIFTSWDVVAYLFTGAPQLGYIFTQCHSLCLFESTVFEINLVRNPYYYDDAWGDWFLKTPEPSEDERWGVSLGQVRNRVFWSSFWVGYWLYLLYDTPWPWRLQYPKERNNLSWLLDPFSRFFRWFNRGNVVFLGFTLFVIASTLVLSPVSDYAIGNPPGNDLAYSCWSHWGYFFFCCFFAYFPVARTGNIIARNHAKRSIHDLRCCINFLRRPLSPLKRKRLLNILLQLWEWYSFALVAFFVYASIPLALKLGSCVLKLVLGPLIWVFGWVHTALGFPVNWVLGFSEFYLLNRAVRWYLAYVSWGGLFALMGVVAFLLYVVVLVWPVLYPYMLSRLEYYHPWIFASDVSKKTRIKFAGYMLWNYVASKWKRP